MKVSDNTAKMTLELIDYAKAHPGKISYATPNSTSLVASETLRFLTKTDIVGVPASISTEPSQS